MATDPNRGADDRETSQRGAGLRRLYRLDELDDFEVADWDPDIRGWDVVAEDGQRLGTIDDLIVDAEARRVRYLDVVLDLLFAGTDTVHHSLLPIGSARLDEDNHHIVLGAAARAALRDAPSYTGVPFDRDYERALHRVYAPDDPAATETTSGFYEHDLYDVDRFAGRRHR